MRQIYRRKPAPLLTISCGTAHRGAEEQAARPALHLRSRHLTKELAVDYRLELVLIASYQSFAGPGGNTWVLQEVNRA